eukprot:GHVN01101296.1.p1 GENE.GHVN01101296.1~~GHVN01101296.1.p1  ORF type:complete len:179 (+),score=27.44 GHVN01101296.1:74-610(+)
MLNYEVDPMAALEAAVVEKVKPSEPSLSQPSHGDSFLSRKLKPIQTVHLPRLNLEREISSDPVPELEQERQSKADRDEICSTRKEEREKDAHRRHRKKTLARLNIPEKSSHRRSRLKDSKKLGPPEGGTQRKIPEVDTDNLPEVRMVKRAESLLKNHSEAFIKQATFAFSIGDGGQRR